PAESLLPSAIVPAREFAQALKAVPRPGRNGEVRQAGILLASPEVILTGGESVFRAVPVEGRFPDANAILPKRPAPVSFKVNPDLLCLLLKAAAEVSRSTGEQPVVEVLVWSAQQPVGVISHGDGGLTFDGLIMPLTA